MKARLMAMSQKKLMNDLFSLSLQAVGALILLAALSSLPVALGVN